MTDPAPHPAGEFEPELGDDYRSRIKSELDPGERPLWAARPAPKPGRVGWGFVVASVTAAALYLGSGIALTAYFRQHVGADGLVVTCVTSFVLASLILWALVSIMTQGRLGQARHADTLYALTDRRAIIWVPEPKRGAVKVYTLPRGSVTGVHRVQYPDGSGDVLFKVNGQQFLGTYWVFSGFEGVPDVRRVEEQVRRTLTDPGAPADPEG